MCDGASAVVERKVRLSAFHVGHWSTKEEVIASRGERHRAMQHRLTARNDRPHRSCQASIPRGMPRYHPPRDCDGLTLLSYQNRNATPGLANSSKLTPYHIHRAHLDRQKLVRGDDKQSRAVCSTE